ncbi:MAG: trypsin-like serine peptidase [Geminicoccaceae bacterium]
MSKLFWFTIGLAFSEAIVPMNAFSQATDSGTPYPTEKFSPNADIWQPVDADSVRAGRPDGVQAILVLEDGRAFRSRRLPSAVAEVPTRFAGKPSDAREIAPDLVPQGARRAGFVAGSTGNTQAAAWSLAAPSEPLGVILGDTDDRNLIGDEQTLRRYPARTIGSLSGNSDGGTGCSGVMVGPRHVLTAAHCLYDSDGNWPSNIYFAPGQRGDEHPNGEPRRMVARYARTWSISWDYGLIILEDRPETAALGWMGMGWYAPLSSYAGKTVFNSGYPISTQECAASPNMNGSCGGFMYGDVCAMDHATGGYAMYDCDTTGGHSGSPVWRYWGDSPVVLAVHKRGNEPGSGADVTSQPATLNLGPRLRPEIWNDLCDWMREWPSQFASHALCSP